MHNFEAYNEARFIQSNDLALIDTATGPSGTEYVCLEQRNRQNWLNVDLLSSNPAAELDAMKAQGLRVFSVAQRNKLLGLIEKATNFPPRDLVERIGWNGRFFGYPDGRALGPEGLEAPVTYATNAVCVTATGTLDGWRENVVIPILNEPFLLFWFDGCSRRPDACVDPTPRQFWSDACRPT